jgi:hypothetical protein
MVKPLHNVRILLVEDDPIIGLDLRQTLEHAGATVVGPAHDVPSATALIRNGPFDVAVLDHLIVGGDSLPLAHELNCAGAQIPFPHEPPWDPRSKIPSRSRDRQTLSGRRAGRGRREPDAVSS